MTCIVISLSLLFLREGKNLGNTFLNELREEEKVYRENKWTRYEGVVVSGAEVINAIKRNQNELVIAVNNLGGEILYSKDNLFIFSNNNILSPSYIEPFDDYIGDIERKKNGEIWKITFIKKR